VPERPIRVVHSSITARLAQTFQPRPEQF
jgi:hypothetical protein